MQDTLAQPLGWEDPLEKGMATHSSILTWRIPWTEEPDRLQSTESQRVRHDWAANTNTMEGKGVVISKYLCDSKLSFEIFGLGWPKSLFELSNTIL